MTIIDRLLGRDKPTTRKAVSGPGVAAYFNGTPLTSLLDASPQRRAAAYLRAYKVGWFYKAESRIANDIAGLSRKVSPEGGDGDNDTELVAAALSVPFDQLSPTEQLLRLLERPNPRQTGRDLFARTMIRLDMTGTAFWYLESPAFTTGLPSAIYGINPARMTPSYSASGQLVGWVMDKDRAGGGVPFRTDEILTFAYPSAEDDVFGQGVVEAVYAEVPLTDRMAQHTGDMLSTGGRLAGMMWPKDRALDEPEYQDAQRAWRNIMSDPNAARRMLIFPEPMEYAAGASTPAEIGIPELALLNRDNILTAFPINPYMVGVPLAAGMNSGETARHVKREYWEGTIHPRVELLEEVIQNGLVARYEAVVGEALNFDIEEPNLDDAETLLAKATAVRELWNLGFDEKEAIGAVGLGHIRFIARPAMPEMTPDPATDDESGDDPRADGPDAMESAVRSFTKALTPNERRTMMAPFEREAARLLASYLADQRERLIDRIRDVFPADKAARKALPESWWDQDVEAAEIKRVLENGLYVRIGRTSATVVAERLNRVVMPNQIAAITRALLGVAGTDIVNILDATRDAVRAALSEGVRRGYSLNQIIDGVADEGYQGVRNVTLANGTPAFGEYRAEVIARTETARSFNTANLIGYREFGVEEVEAFDGDEDGECAARNGQTFSLEEALTIEDHPNGTLDWVPIAPKSARLPEPAEFTISLPAPIVHPTPVTVAPTPVTVAAPDLGPIAEALVALADAQKTMATEMAELKAPKRLVRDAKGRIVGLE